MASTGKGNNMTGGGDVIPKGYKAGQQQQFTPEQMKLFQQTFQHVAPGSYLNRLAGGDQGAFEQMEAPAMRQFQELQGQNASRFSGAGMGARRSSGFQNQMTQDTSNFAQDLASKRMTLQSQALKDLMGISESLLGQSPYKKFLVKKDEQKTGWGGLIGAGLGAAGGFFAGGPAGAMAGAKLGQSVGSAF